MEVNVRVPLFISYPEHPNTLQYIVLFHRLSHTWRFVYIEVQDTTSSHAVIQGGAIFDSRLPGLANSPTDHRQESRRRIREDIIEQQRGYRILKVGEFAATHVSCSYLD